MLETWSDILSSKKICERGNIINTWFDRATERPQMIASALVLEKILCLYKKLVNQLSFALQNMLLKDQNLYSPDRF